MLVGGDQGLARVISISDQEITLSTKLDIYLRDHITVDFSEKCSVTGEAAWLKPGQCGLMLVVPIDSAALLQRLAAERARSDYRPLRLTTETQVVVRSQFGLQILRLRDISQYGVKLVHDGRLQAGMPVNLQLAPDVERRGIVRWSIDGIAGLELEERLQVDQLGSVRRI
jgi:hypothetical protein